MLSIALQFAGIKPNGFFSMLINTFRVYWTMQVFGSDAACAGYLGTLITVLFGQSVSMLTSIQVRPESSWIELNTVAHSI
jgi:hypothetical protein